MEIEELVWINSSAAEFVLIKIMKTDKNLTLIHYIYIYM